MALIGCPECHKKISESAQICPHCGFSFKEEDLEKYKITLEERRLQNQQINRQNSELQLIWLMIFAMVLFIADLILN